MKRPYLYLGAVALLYALSSVPGRVLLIPNVFVAPLRLSAGAAIAALTLAPTRHWWLVILAFLPLHAWVGDPSTRYLVALQYLAANTAEAVIVAGGLRWLLGDRPRLDNLKSCVIFLVTAVIIGPLVGATIGAPVVIRRELTVSAFSTWEIWAFADAAGNLVVVPLCLALADAFARLSGRPWPRPSVARVVEGAMVWIGILLTTAPGLGQAALGRRGSSLSMLYAPFPLLVWAAIRFGPLGAARANLLMMVITMLHALTSRAPFGEPWDVNSVIETQQFLIVAGATSITLAALIAERWRAREAERASEEARRLAFEGGRVASWTWTFDDDRFEVSDEMSALTGLPPGNERTLTELSITLHPDDRDDALEDLSIRRSGVVSHRAGQYRLINPDGTISWVKGRFANPEEVWGQYRLIRPDGSTAWVEGHTRTLRDADGLPHRAVGVVIDISQQKELEVERAATASAMMRLARSSFGDRGEIEEALREIVTTAADTLRVERAGVWLLSEDSTRLRGVCLYARASRVFSSGAEITVDACPDYIRAILGMRTLAIEDSGTDPRVHELVVLDSMAGIRSMLDAPFYIGGRLAGVFSMHHSEPREWSLPARNFGASMTDLVSRAFEAVERRKAEEKLHRAYEQLRHLARRLEAAKEDERRDIARELHDELGQSVTAIVIGLHLVTLDDREGRHTARLKDTVALAEKLITRVRAISLNLRPPLLDELGLVTALRGFLEGQAQQSGLAIQFDADGVDQKLASELQVGAYRIVQECLTNVARHAAAKTVNVRVAAEGEHLVIEVRDDGHGFDVTAVLAASARGRHLGLLGMQERITVLGGQVAFDSAPGKGTRIAARLPLQLAG